MIYRLKHHSGENSDNGSGRDEEEDAANMITDLGPIEYPKGLWEMGLVMRGLID